MNLQTHGNIMKRIAITLALGVAFIVMASIFKPERSTANNSQRQGNRARPAAIPTREPAIGPGMAMISADAHAGLQSMGVLESGRYIIAIFATDMGPRYTIFDSETQQELGTLLSAEKLRQLMPEIDLKGLDFSAPADQQPLMLAEPRE